MNSSDSMVTLAAAAGAHGIGGEVRLKLFAQGVDSLKAHKRLFAGDRVLTLKSVKPGSAGAIARFAEIADRAAAEALRGTLLTVPRSELPPLEEGEYYHADLIGLPCIDQAGAPLGHVVAVENFGAGDLLEIAKPDGRRALIPFRPGIADRQESGIVADPDFLA
jgi:16S rRNA processing protein RimM